MISHLSSSASASKAILWQSRFADVIRLVVAPLLLLFSGFFTMDFILSGAYSWPRTSRIMALTLTLAVLIYEFIYKEQQLRHPEHSFEQRMVGRAEIGEKPELLWEHPRLEGLNAILEDEFEIHERLAALDRKLELVARTERTLVDLISTRHALRVEWYIVALIVLEILLTVYGMALR